MRQLMTTTNCMIIYKMLLTLIWLVVQTIEFALWAILTLTYLTSPNRFRQLCGLTQIVKMFARDSGILDWCLRLAQVTIIVLLLRRNYLMQNHHPKRPSLNVTPAIVEFENLGSGLPRFHGMKCFQRDDVKINSTAFTVSF